jgi:hypothetical protein
MSICTRAIVANMKMVSAFMQRTINFYQFYIQIYFDGNGVSRIKTLLIENICSLAGCMMIDANAPGDLCSDWFLKAVDGNTKWDSTFEAHLSEVYESLRSHSKGRQAEIITRLDTKKITVFISTSWYPITGNTTRFRDVTFYEDDGDEDVRNNGWLKNSL